MSQPRQVSKRRKGKWIVNTVLALICLVWIVPTAGLFISSFRTADDIRTTGWWTILPHKDWAITETISLPPDTNLREPIVLDGVELEDRELRSGVQLDDGTRLIWANRSAREIGIQERQWTMNTNFTFDNYLFVLTGKQYEITDANGNTRTQQGDNLSRAFLNTIAVAVPATIIPVTIATFAAYAFSWMRFRGRNALMVLILGLLVVPIQVALIPVLNDFMQLGINGNFLAVWLVHTGFGLSLATYFMSNFIGQLPGEIFESAFMDGATHFTMFTRLVLPLAVPALASVGIFQFMWVWNDYLIALIFLGSTQETMVLSMRLADMVGTRGADWHLLTAGAFVSMLLPLTVFFALQRYFVRGLLGGSVKG